MRLLPDINIYGTTLSLQAPYTLNGMLIVNIGNLMVSSNHSSIQLQTYDGLECRLDIDDINCEIRSLNLFDFLVEDDTGTYSNSLVDASCYYSLVSQQCTEIRNCSSYLGDLMARLSEQRRLSARMRDYWTARIRNDTFYYDETLAPYQVSSYRDPLPFTWLSTSPSSADSYIHAYNYKPEYIHHTLEDETSPLLLGAEIEVDSCEETVPRNEVVKKCIDIINGDESGKEDLIYSTSDSSVQIELDTMPCSLEFHKQKMNYAEMFKYLDELGYKGHDGQHAGLHIHADRSYLGATPLIQQLTISKILYILEKFNDEICMIARRDTRYSAFVGDGKDERSVIELYGKYKEKGKNVALNLKHPNTIEFRCFKSTLKPETFLLTLEFVKDIIDYAKKINIEDIELIKWDDLMVTFSAELQDYYEERCKKAEKKDKKTSEKIKDTWEGCVDRLHSILSSTDFDFDEPITTYDTLGSLRNFLGRNQ